MNDKKDRMNSTDQTATPVQERPAFGVIDVRDITKTYHLGEVEVPALRGVSFQIQRGEVVAIMGASGSGKSTLMNILGCLDLPTSGEYFLGGENIAGMTEDELAHVRNQKIGFVFQQFNLLPRMSVLRNVELALFYSNGYGGKSWSDPRKRAEEVLGLVGLSDRMNHRPTELSGGQQQRVAIARALVNEPEIILADEPTGNLDSHTGADIMRLLLEMNKQRNITLVIVTHDPTIAEQSQRTIHILDGLLEDGDNGS